MLADCAEASGIARDGLPEWIGTRGLDDPKKFVPALDAALVEIVGEDRWLFDRGLLAQPLI